MKKTLIFLVILALAIPSAALAATEFSLGGYMKLEAFWDSSQNNAYMYGAVARNNDVAGTHGRFDMRSNESRINFTIKGPKLWGAQTTGFLEMDFDGTTDSGNVSSSGTWLARVRHAMFRLNWPETELLMGQYWGLFDNFIPESADDGPMMQYTTALDRIPQIRLTQKFLADWSVAGLVGLPLNVYGSNANPFSGASNSAGNAQSAETPQLQGMIQYTHDWWGKAAYYGVPKPFTISVSAGWEHALSRLGTGVNEFGQNGYTSVASAVVNQKTLNPWIVQGGMFIPVIPTHSANLAGTASAMTSWFVGQGVEAFGMLNTLNLAAGTNLAKFMGTVNRVDYFEPSLLNRFGGMAQAQYYFTNEWYLNAAYGLTRNFGVNRATNALLGATADEWRTQQEVDATLWYRPIQALKFGVMYSYVYSDYFQKLAGVAGSGHVDPTNTSNQGNEHRVEFVGIFYF